MKIDKRKHYILVLDTETANSLDDPLVYDIGFAVADTKGHIYERFSFIVKEIFCDEKDLMKSSYFANKIPRYWEEIKQGKRQIKSLYNIRKVMVEVMRKYEITEVSAHNARFDYRSTNLTQRWLTKSRFRYFFPFGTVMWDSLQMARDVILKMPTYCQFCEDWDLLTANGKPKATAEALYSFIINDPTFEESHTALEDVEIETAILAYCFRQHKKMRKRLWGE